MDGLIDVEGEGCLGMVSGRAGRGKSRTVTWWHTNNVSIYLRCAEAWRGSVLGFLRALCRGLGDDPEGLPHRKYIAYERAVDRLSQARQPVFLDEIEKLDRSFLDLVRDLSDEAAVPVVLIGEEELVTAVRRNRRVWSRVYQSVEFAPIAPSDIILFAGETAHVALTPEFAAAFHKQSGGDFRIIKRDLLVLKKILVANQAAQPTAEMVKSALSMGLSGR
jgi:hypothetical protein